MKSQQISREKKQKKRTVSPKKARLAAKRKKQRQKRKQVFLELLGAIIVTCCLVFSLSLVLFSMPKVQGYSMVPTLRDGERVYVNKLGKIKKFKLVCLRIPGKNQTEIRRIIGLPGQRVTYKNDQLQIDGQDQTERFISKEQKKSKENGRFYTENFSLFTLTGQQEIPEGKYLVLGDNRPYAVDSRQYGFIDQKQIIGVVEMRVLPLHLVQSF